MAKSSFQGSHTADESNKSFHLEAALSTPSGVAQAVQRFIRGHHRDDGAGDGAFQGSSA